MNCGKDCEWFGVQYEYGHPEHYDGVSEWMCNVCKKRVGRFSGKELKDGEFEKRSARFEET